MADAPQKPPADLSQLVEGLHAPAGDTDQMSDALHSEATLHEIPSLGAYAVPYAHGWLPLVSAVETPALGLAFNPRLYPWFDGIVAETFGHHALVQADHMLYPQQPYAGLRTNIATLRNHLMQVYYQHTPEGITADKATEALREMARYMGDGLHFNPFPGGLTPKRDANQPFIDMHSAAQPDGKGAQYLYERLLETDRHSGWLRPFEAILSLFSGQVVDWRLPPADSTPFHTLYDTAKPLETLSVEEIDAELARLDTVEAQQRQRQEALELTQQAADLDALGTQLVHTAERLRDVSAMSEPVRQDAVEIARDILRKLKVSIGAASVLDGLGLRPNESLDELGGLKAVALVYERLLAWGRGIDASILQHPSIVAATRAVGQLGVIARLDAIRLMKLGGQAALAQQTQAQIAQTPQPFHKPNEKHLSELLEHVESGIDAVLNRIVTISGPGAQVGHTRSNEPGHYMGGTPIAGTAMQARAEGVNRDNLAKQVAAANEAQLATQRAQLQRLTQQANQQARATGGNNVATGNTASRNQANAQLQAVRQRLQQARRAAQQQALRASAAARTANPLAQHHHDDHAHQPQPHQPPEPVAATLAKMDPRLLNNIKQMNTMTAGLTTNPVVTGRAAFDKMRQANTYGLKNPAPNAPKPLTEEEKKKQQQNLTPPPPPKKDHGRGF